MPWQKDFLRKLFGWLKPDGTRRYTRVYLEVGKKNGKSTLLSALVPYLLLADEMGPKVFINALTQKQAKIIFDEASAMIRSSPELLTRLKPLQSINRIVCDRRNGFCQANSQEAPSQDGVSASVTIFDELHRQKDRSLWNMFEYAGSGREQPIHISITTAGEDELGIWFEQRQYAERVNDGSIDDTSFLGVVYRVDPEKDDLEDPAVWKKANPSLNVIINEETFRNEYEKARRARVI
jgi:phage terminase large subunit-like protein